VQGHVKDFCAEKEGPSTKEVSKVQQGSLARREIEAMKIGLGMSMALSKDPLADRQGPG
jgi:hypothetical protein